MIFDLDDTLLDHGGAVRDALSAWLGADVGVDGSDVARVWSDLERRHYGDWQAGLVSLGEQRRRRVRDLRRHLGRPDLGEEELDRLFAGYLRHYQQAWRAFDDALPALDRLTACGVATVVLTNGSTAQQNAKIDAAGLRGPLRAVITSEELGVAKPDPAAFLRTCERLGVPPGQTVHVGDRHDLDVVAARAAGLRAVHLDRQQVRPDPAGERITTLGQLAGHPALARPGG